ncbi:DEAD/DEAH box helicase [uncultured Desulfosarcina sp.]|uniref:DEAD/DEAH box helicase n=1 Tax=uncultured Desulfosarcina sp. TaxID=218289 RepID=UPI0029C618FF|nr:DEAD/DEAH box helicase [uncultured Desulfosarcina sp.]
MTHSHPIEEYILALKAAKPFEGQVAYHREFSPVQAAYGTPATSWPEPIEAMLRGLGIDRLYRHQIQSMDATRQGKHVVAATPTASGKTLTYALPVIEAVLNDPDARALFIYPLKALAQDQRKTIGHIASNLPQMELRAEIYDGDTSAYRRKKIRDNPPHILMTNPEMIHLSICPHHDRWADLLARLRYVVVDEVHTYRGILGSHMAQVFRRLLRLCRHYGAAPTFVFTSATVANPEELASQLTGLTVDTVKESTAGRGKRHLLVIDPVDGPLTATLMMLKAALSRNLRTIVYTQSRKLTELLAIWAKNRSGAFADRISAYRAGFLPEERREIEAKLASGELLAVISTSALELGIDIGSLDLCLLVGYPGSIVATWQRGGRVGRSGQESAVVLVAGEDALDQFFIRHPEQLVQRPPEAAVVNAANPDVMDRHLVCAAAELALKMDDPMLKPEAFRAGIDRLVADGRLYLSADGTTCYSPLKRPHRLVDLRGSGSRFVIVDASDERVLGEIDGYRVYREAHPGAIYLHRGQTFRVESLDPETRKVWVEAARVSYHTRVRSDKDTQILEILEQKPAYATTMAIGRLRVTEQVSGYDRIDTRNGKVLERCPLDLPPMTFETQGLWFIVPAAIIDQAEKAWIHVMGGLHAMEHAAIGVFPLLVMADRNDLGGISTPYHPQLEAAGIFIYDGLPGGAGLCIQAFKQGEALLDITRGAIADCPCESGCPSCVHSPKCGSGNRPIDKDAALFFLKALKNTQAPKNSIHFSIDREDSKESATVKISQDGKKTDSKAIRYGVLDIETQRSAKEVGGWHRAARMKVSCAVLYDSQKDAFFEYVEGQVPALFDKLRELDLVIGFNIKRFDYLVLSAYTDMDFGCIPTLDLLEKVKDRLGYRLSLDHLASATLNAGKTADGLDALRWWKEGQMAKILEYCRSDVAITRDLFRFGRENRYVLFRNKAEQTVRLPVDW